VNKPPDHPNEHVQRRIDFLKSQIAAYQSEVARLVKEAKVLRRQENRAA